MPNLKIVSYNIHRGLETDTLIKNIKNFARGGVTIFCLQEFWKWMMPVDLEPLLLNALGSEWQMEYETPEQPYHHYGACILWKKSVLQSISFQRLSLPLIPRARASEKAFIRANGFGPETYIAQRGALVGTFRWNNRLLRITTLHLDWQGGFKQRAKQIDYIKDYLASQPDADFEVICGDFNTIGVFNKAKQIKKLVDVLGNGFSNACGNPSITCPPFILDHILVKNFRVIQFQTYKLPGSDHFPVLADLVA